VAGADIFARQLSAFLFGTELALLSFVPDVRSSAEMKRELSGVAMRRIKEMIKD